MCKKLIWTSIDPIFHNLAHLNGNDEVYYHLEYSKGGYEKSSANQWVINYKKDIEFRGETSWQYKQKAIKDFAELISNHPPKCNDFALLAGATSKHRKSPLFDSRNEDTLRLVHDITGIPISFNLETVSDFEPLHHQPGFRKPSMIYGRYRFIPFKTVPEAVYIVDDVITSGVHFVVWKNLIQKVHPGIEVRGLYLARTVAE